MEETGAAIARMEEQIRGLARRMDNLERLTESVQSLALSVERLTNQQASTEEHVETLTQDVNDIKEKPVKYWMTVVTALISALVGAGIGHFIK